MTRGKAKSCDMQPEELQKAIDGEAGASGVVGHVAGCKPCSSTLEVLGTQRDAVQFLAGAERAKSAGGAVEFLLKASARSGREKLADLVYELAKACMVVVPEMKRRVERLVEPRDVPVVMREAKTVNSRLAEADRKVDVAKLPQNTPDVAGAMAAMNNCLKILENVEGRSERMVLVQSQYFTFGGHAAQSEALLRALLDSGHVLCHRALVQRNTMLAMMEQSDYARAAAFGDEILRESPDDLHFLYNTSVCLAAIGERKRFEAVGRHLAHLLTDARDDLLVSHLKDQVPNFAETLRCSHSEIQRCFGLAPIKDEVS